MQASRFRGGLDRRKHGVGDESNQRGDTVHLDTIVKRVSAFCRKSIAAAGLRSTLIARGWKFFTSTSTLHFSRQHPSEHFDPAFGNRQTQESAPSRSPTQQPPTLRPPSFIHSNASLRRDGRPAGVDAIVRRVPGRLYLRFLGSFLKLVHGHVDIPKATVLSMATSTRSALASVSNHLVAKSWIALTTDTIAGPHLSCG